MNITSDTSHAVYVPGAAKPFDSVRRDGRTRTRGLTIEQVRQETGQHAEIVPVEEAIARIELTAITPPMQVTQERFVCMRDVMPPYVLTLHRDESSESFQLTEPIILGGKVMRTLVRIGNTHWEFQDRADRPHFELVAKVRRKMNDDLLAALSADREDQRAKGNLA